MRHRILLVVVGVALLAAACSASGSDEEWGAAAEEYFSEWSHAWASGNAYDIARFYGPDVAVGLAQDYRALSMSAGFRSTAVSGQGRAWLVDWIAAQYVPKDRSLAGVFVGDSSAVVLTAVAEGEIAYAAAMDLEEGLIVGYTDLRWRDAHLPGGRPDARVGWLDDLVSSRLASGADAAAESVGTITTGDRSGPAVFLGPDTAAYVVMAELDGCLEQHMVVLTLDDDRNVTAEERLLSLERRCDSDDVLPAGWWDEIEVPPAIGQQATGMVGAADGSGITVFNGSPELEELLTWGLARFEIAGLVRPQLSSASFAPLPVCSSSQGGVTDSGDGGPDLVLCTDAYRVCEPDRAACTSFSIEGRLALLHELAHVWLLDNLDTEGEEAFVSSRGLEHWVDGSVSWHRRGAEQAAEIIAWGLMDVDIDLVRIGRPDCGDAAAGYELLTGLAPLRVCD